VLKAVAAFTRKNGAFEASQRKSLNASGYGGGLVLQSALTAPTHGGEAELAWVAGYVPWWLPASD